MESMSLFHWMVPLLPVLGLAAIGVAVWLAVGKANSGAVPEAANPAADDEKTLALEKMAHVVYGLFSAALIFALFAIAGLILAHLKKSEAQGTWLESHFRWQIRTFWFMLLWSILGMILFFVVIGWVIFIAAAVWYIYRVVFGWVSLAESRTMMSVAKGLPA